MPKAMSTNSASDVGKLSEKTIATVVKWTLQKFKAVCGVVPTEDKKQELITKLRALDMANMLQDPTHWYVRGNADRACIYGNRMYLSKAGSLDGFEQIGFDSTGIIPRSDYDMEAMADILFPWKRTDKLCGLGLRVELEARNQSGHIGQFGHVLNSGYAYDKPLQDEIRRRAQDVMERCADPETTKTAIAKLALKLDELYPFETDHASRISLVRLSRQPKTNDARHFKLRYDYPMMIHSGRIVDTSHEFKVNVTNDGLKLVNDDLFSYDKARKSEGARRLAYSKYKNGLKLSRLAANVIPLLNAAQRDQLFGGGVLTFKQGESAYALEAKKLEIITSVNVEGAIIKDKSVHITRPIPESLADSLIGQPLRKLIEHPVITDDMIITKFATVLGTPVFTYKAPPVLFKE